MLFSLQASNGSKQETHDAEHMSEPRPIADVQRNVDRIVGIARVLYYLDQVSF